MKYLEERLLKEIVNTNYVYKSKMISLEMDMYYYTLKQKSKTLGIVHEVFDILITNNYKNNTHYLICEI